MSYEEAVHRAVAYAQSRGYDTHVKKAHLTGDDVWKVKLHVARGDADGKMDVDLNAWSREVIRANENLKYRKHDHDDDDHGPGRGRGKGKGGRWSDNGGKSHAASAVADARGSW